MVSSNASAFPSSNVIDEDDESEFINRGMLAKDRYVTTNRLSIRSGQGPAFEARWANRKSHLMDLPGFKYFHLMRRVTLNEDGTQSYDEGNANDGSNLGNYMSVTVWEKKSNYSAWRKGGAFLAAHGGGSIRAFMSTMIFSAKVMKRPPKPAYFDGLLVESNAPAISNYYVRPEADGVSNLPEECFVACNQFYIPDDNAVEFEQKWAKIESLYKENDDLVAFSLMRRDKGTKGLGIIAFNEASEATYVTTTIWKNRVAFEAWKKDNISEGSSLSKFKTSDLFYEGVLVLSKPEGF